MITADTITDEQIVALRNVALKAGDTELVGTCHDAMPGSMRWEPVADWGESRPVSVDVRREARRQIAEILNARAKEQP